MKDIIHNLILELQHHTKIIDVFKVLNNLMCKINVLNMLNHYFTHYKKEFYRNCICQLQYKSFLLSL